MQIVDLHGMAMSLLKDLHADPAGASNPSGTALLAVFASVFTDQMERQTKALERIADALAGTDKSMGLIDTLHDIKAHMRS